MRRYNLGDEALIRYSYGSDRRQPYRRVTICGILYHSVYDYLAIDLSGVVCHVRDDWLVPSDIVITEDVDLTDLLNAT